VLAIPHHFFIKWFQFVNSLMLPLINHCDSKVIVRSMFSSTAICYQLTLTMAPYHGKTAKYSCHVVHSNCYCDYFIPCAVCMEVIPFDRPVIPPHKKMKFSHSSYVLIWLMRTPQPMNWLFHFSKVVLQKNSFCSLMMWRRSSLVSIFMNQLASMPLCIVYCKVMLWPISIVACFNMWKKMH